MEDQEKIVQQAISETVEKLRLAGRVAHEWDEPLVREHLRILLGIYLRALRAGYLPTWEEEGD